MTRLPSFDDVLNLHTEAWLLLAEAQWVAATRLMGLTGLRPAARSETALMLAEKAPAFAEAAGAALAAAVAGGSPVEMAQAWIAPIRQVTHENALRLRGPED